MNTKTTIVNDAFISIDENMQYRESFVRLFLTASLLSVIFVDPTIQLKFLYVVPALYLYTTALMKWDPIYALLRSFKIGDMNHKSVNQIKSVRMADIAADDKGNAANDVPTRFDGGLKNAG